MTPADPMLTERVDRLKPGETLDAIFSLHPVGDSDLPADVDRVTHELMARVEEQVGDAAQELVVFANMRSFAVRAGRSVLTELLCQSEIASATTNRLKHDSGV